MKNKDLISKWLNNELDAEQLAAFKKTPDYLQYGAIVEHATRFKTPEFDPQIGLRRLKEKLASPREVPVRRINTSLIYKIAAIFIMVLGTGYFFLMNQPTTIRTGNSETAMVELPDRSTVKLNAGSRLKYRPEDWKTTRSLKLEGEAYFQVEKGMKFTVKTDQGDISVVGTKFNIKERKGYFEVSCFEGAVRVNTKDREVLLTKGKSFRILNGEQSGLSTFDSSTPGWLQQESAFNAVPLEQVLAELERQFDLEIDPENINLDQLFTGSFSHTDLEIALKSITIPLRLKYKILSDKDVVLYEE